MQWATFIGPDGDMGLRTGRKYLVKIKRSNGYVWVTWIDPAQIFTGSVRYPYVSYTKAYENWIFN